MESALLNAWNMAGWASEVATSWLARRICGLNMLVLRRDDGTLAALQDRCPHRFAPLSRGERVGDTIVCGYHGLRFDTAGKCVGNPFSDKLPVGATVRTFPVAERGGIIWVWPGDPALADERLIADLPFLSTTPASMLLHGYTRMLANYEYGTDNLMDLSHIEFVHRGTFAGAGVIFAGKHEIVADGDTLHSNWWMPDVAAPGHTTGIYPPDMRTDHWLDMRWNAPATMYLDIGATPCDAPREQGVIVEQAHILTAETENTSHYFWATTATFPLDDPSMASGFKAMFAKAFDEEDKPMIEAACANTDGKDFWEQSPVFLGIDAGGVRARRLLQTMRKREVAMRSAKVDMN